MAKYQITVTETFSYTVNVQADNPTDATEKVSERLDDFGAEPSSEMMPDDIERQFTSVLKM